MTRSMLIAAALIAVSVSAHAQTPFAFRSVSIDLPNGTRMFPGGKDAEAINANCLTCHSAGMVLTQPALTKAAWDAEVHKMIGVFKAPVAASDIPAIVAYLVATQGK